MVQIYYTHAEDKDQFFFVLISKDSNRVFADTEDIDSIESTEVSGTPAEITKKNGVSSIVWIDSKTGLTYTLSSTLDQGEIIKIAENISSN